MTSEYRKELIQVAAVAVAMIHDDIQGSTKMNEEGICMDTDDLLGFILWERRKQEAKWGPQHHSKEKWLAILTEEVGEVARAILENK